MNRWFNGILAVVMAVWASCAVAQDLSGLARAEVEGSGIEVARNGAVQVQLALTQGVPFRVYTLAEPPRLVVDFREVDFAALDPAQMLPEPGLVSAVRFGAFQPGWSRMVADLAEHATPRDVGMKIDAASGAAVLELTLSPVNAEVFAQSTGAPTTGFAPATTVPVPAARDEAAFVVMLDPGHGGIDPGAEREGLVEKEIALDFARVVRDMLRREGIAVEMTRDADVFVSLEGRTAQAHQANASLFVSLHADALSQGGAQGATVYTLSEEASDTASALLAERHDRSDILAGVDLSGADDGVTWLLLDLARRETEPRSRALAEAIIDGMAQSGGPMNRKPWRKAGFSVLKSADIPSVLVEIGFLSSARDRKNLADPVWRGVIASGIVDAIVAWRDEDAARKHLVRQ